MRKVPNSYAGRRFMKAIRRCAPKIGFFLIPLLVAAALLWNGPVLRAQDDPQPPDAPSSFLFLPSLAGGIAVEAGTVIPGQFIVVLHDVSAREATGPVESTSAAAARLAASVDGEILYVYDAALNGF